MSKNFTHNNYLKAGSLYLIGNLFNKGIGFLAIPIFTRVLTPFEYGIINTYTSWVSIFVSIVGLCLHMSIRVGFADHEDDIDSFVSSITSFLLLNLAIMIPSILAILYLIKIDLGISLSLILLALIQAGGVAINNNYDEYLKFKIEYKKKTLFQILPNLLTVSISIPVIIYLNSNRYLGKIFPNVFFVLLISFFVLKEIYKKSKNINWNYVKIALPVSIPIIAHGMSLTLLSQSDRIMLTSISGAEQTGIYSLIYNFSMAVTVISHSFDSIWVPWFIRNLKLRNIELINKKAKDFVFLMTIPIIGLIMIAPELLRIIAPEQYWGANISIPLIVISSYLMFIYTLYVNVEHIHKKTKYIARNTIIAALLNIFLNYFAISQYGYHGAAATTLISYICSFYLHYRSAKKLEKSVLPVSNFYKSFLFIAINTLIYYLFLNAPIIRIFFLIVQLSLIGYFNFSKIQDLLNLKNN